jgi:homoserine O-acetyltransferase
VTVSDGGGQPAPDRPSAPTRPVPATGAWKPGDPVGARRFVPLGTSHPFALEGGGALRNISIAYETWGQLSPTGDNAVLVCHALTGDSHAAGRSGEGHGAVGWWDEVIGPGRALDTDRYFVVCCNVLGGCQGTTGPSSVDPTTGRAFGSTFPIVTIRDMVRTQAAVADQLGIRQWLSVVGGSMGGMQVLEWGVMYPNRVRSLVPIGVSAQATAQQIAFSAIERQSIALDPRWRRGDYYDAPPGEGPHRGLALARSLAQVTYRSDAVFNDRFGRKVVEELDFTMWQRFDVEGYLDYQGMKLALRFDANTYLLLTKAMDLHDIGRGRGGVAAALARISVPTRLMSISSDALYYPYQQEQIVDELRNHAPADLLMIESPHGHDGFLIDTDQVNAAVAEFLTAVEKDDV